MNNSETIKTIFVWTAFILVAVLLYKFVANQGEPTEVRIAYSDFLDRVQRGSVEEVQIIGSDITGISKTGERFRTVKADDPELTNKLIEQKIRLTVEIPQTNPWLQALLSSAPFLVVIGLWILFMRKMRIGGIKAYDFGKSRARIETVRKIYQAFGKGDIAAILNQLANDVEWEYGPNSTNVPWLQPRWGKAQVMEFFQSLAGMEIQKFEPTRLLADGNVVVALIQLEATVRSTGRKIIEADEVHIWHFGSDGLIVKFRHRVDTYQHWAAFSDR